MRTKKELCNGLHQFLGLRSNLIAVRMLRDESEIPANAVRPLRDTGHHLSGIQSSQKTGTDHRHVASGQLVRGAGYRFWIYRGTRVFSDRSEPLSGIRQLIGGG